jgi:chloramphenicol-sensitive protein RarD
VFWAFLVLAALCVAQRRGREIAAVFQARRTAAVLALAAAFIALNWLGYVWAVANARVLETSLGYYMNPLLNVLFGVAVLGERLERPVQVAVAIAAAAVAWLAVSAGHVPWIALLLATSFALYGLMRKLAPVGAVVGLLVETAFLLPLAGGYLAWAAATGRSAFVSSGATLGVLLALSGPVTAIPLLFFAGAARRLPLSTLGFLQYLSPTLQFLLAVLVYREPFDRARLVAFVLIWIALAVFAWHSARRGAPEPVTDA